MSKNSEMSRDELWQQDYDYYMNTGELSEFFEDEDDYEYDEYDEDDYSNPKNNKQSQEVARYNLQGIIVAIVLISIMVYALLSAIS